MRTRRKWTARREVEWIEDEGNRRHQERWLNDFAGYKMRLSNNSSFLLVDPFDGRFRLMSVQSAFPLVQFVPFSLCHEDVIRLSMRICDGWRCSLCRRSGWMSGENGDSFNQSNNEIGKSRAHTHRHNSIHQWMICNDKRTNRWCSQPPSDKMFLFYNYFMVLLRGKHLFIRVHFTRCIFHRRNKIKIWNFYNIVVSARWILLFKLLELLIYSNA